MLCVLVGGGGEDYELIRACGQGGSLPHWVVPKTASAGDAALIHVPGRGFVARGIVAENPKYGSFGDQPAYRSGLTQVCCFPTPVPLPFLEARLPDWGWLRQRMKSRHTPTVEVADSLLRFITEYQADLETVATPGSPVFSEGRPQAFEGIRHERNPAARLACIEHHGATCSVCGFAFGVEYGPELEGFILVHHLELVSASRRSRAVSPVRDMRPVCANCHMVMHRKNPPFTVAEVQRMRKNHRAG